MCDIFETKLINYTRTINEIYFHTLGHKFIAKFYTESQYNEEYASIIIQFYNDCIDIDDILDKLCELLNIQNDFSFYEKYNDMSDCYVLSINGEGCEIIKYDSKEICIQEITNILNRLLGE